MPFSASAHGDEARVQLSATQAQPGTTIEVHGSGFEPDDQTTIMLVSTDRPQLLGSATTDEDGNLARVVLLPMDATDGLYEVRVTDTHHVAGATLHIMTDLNGDEAGTQRDESEPLLSAMPTNRSDAAPTPSTAAAPPQTAAAGESPTAWLLLPVGMLAVVGLALVLRHRSGQ